MSLNFMSDLIQSDSFLFENNGNLFSLTLLDKNSCQNITK